MGMRREVERGNNFPLSPQNLLRERQKLYLELTFQSLFFVVSSAQLFGKWVPAPLPQHPACASSNPATVMSLDNIVMFLTAQKYS